MVLAIFVVLVIGDTAVDKGLFDAKVGYFWISAILGVLMADISISCFSLFDSFFGLFVLLFETSELAKAFLLSPLSVSFGLLS